MSKGEAVKVYNIILFSSLSLIWHRNSCVTKSIILYCFSLSVSSDTETDALQRTRSKLSKTTKAYSVSRMWHRKRGPHSLISECCWSRNEKSTSCSILLLLSSDWATQSQAAIILFLAPCFAETTSWARATRSPLNAIAGRSPLSCSVGLCLHILRFTFVYVTVRILPLRIFAASLRSAKFCWCGLTWRQTSQSRIFKVVKLPLI